MDSPTGSPDPSPQGERPGLASQRRGAARRETEIREAAPFSQRRMNMILSGDNDRLMGESSGEASPIGIRVDDPPLPPQGPDGSFLKPKAERDDSPSSISATFVTNNVTPLCHPGGEVFLSGAALKEVDTDAILSLLEEKPRTKLVLANNQLGDYFAEELAKHLAKDTSIKYISLHRNQIGPSGALALAGALKVNTALETLFLTNNRIGETAATSLADANRKRAKPMMTGLNGLMCDFGSL